MPQDTEPGQVFMDLGDFTPEEYEWSLSLKGNRYTFRYQEATVDEVLRLMRPLADDEDMIVQRRRTVVGFLQKTCVAGDPEVFARDMQEVPYTRPEAPYDIDRLFSRLLSRIKKKAPGDDTSNPTT